MDLDALLTPLSENQPCGPDLNEILDPGYEEYYFDALGRLPAFYYQPGVQRPDGSVTPDKLFDPGSVDLATETARIDALLGRSRDIRLMVLRAQWCALAGRIGPLADSVAMLARMIATFGADLHPQLHTGATDRREALADLNQQLFVVLPLQFAGLTGSTEVSLRKMRVAQGKAKPMQDEAELTPDALLSALGDASARRKVDDTHAALLRLSAALETIVRLCQTNPAAPFSPPLDAVRETVTEMLELIGSARPDLRGAVAAAAEDPAPEAPTAPPEPERPGGGLSLPPVQGGGTAPKVLSHEHARGILESCERYYRQFEPSSAALLMVTQARLLIGMPLIDAIEVLLPQQAAQVQVDFGPQSGFALNLERLKTLTRAAPEGTAPASPAMQAPPAPPPPVFSKPADVAAAIRAVEEYFRLSERSSPVPVLLQRARSYLDKDFQSLIDELIPRKSG